MTREQWREEYEAAIEDVVYRRGVDFVCADAPLARVTTEKEEREQETAEREARKGKPNEGK